MINYHINKLIPLIYSLCIHKVSIICINMYDLYIFEYKNNLQRVLRGFNYEYSRLNLYFCMDVNYKQHVDRMVFPYL